MFDKTDQLAINTVRLLSVDQIEKANSGHPGLPMGAAPMAYTLWSKHLTVNPDNPYWINRDRFVLSAGHGSAMLYSLLHLSGFNVTMNDLKEFRQVGSITPGHPEVHFTEGVDTTTGPLGQGFANAVGMAMAEAHLAAQYNEDGFNLVDHYTYTLVGDGDLQEGISYEAASLAGHLNLEKLIVLYDSNDIQLDGPLDRAFSEDIQKRFESQGWEYLFVEDGQDLNALNEAIKKAKASDKPSLIEVKTVIGEGAPNAGTSEVHGAPLGEEGVSAARKAYKWEFEETFHVPEDVYNRFSETITESGREANDEWDKLFDEYKTAYPEKANQFERAMNKDIEETLADALPVYTEDDNKATRAISNEVINAIADVYPSFWGGSADLSGSNKTTIDSGDDFSKDNYAGRNIWYGVREHAMASALNGIALHGGTTSFVSTFFVFSDYLRPAVRLAALSKIPAIYVFTHDSVAVGEDGPTHEPVEQLASYRAMHNVNVIRPADGNEVSAAWKIAVESKDRPTMLVLTRQNVPTLLGSEDNRYENVERGAYVISPQEGNKPDGILIATGSEVSLAIEAQKALREDSIDVSVVSMPSMNLFDEQSDAYKETVLPTKVTKRLAIEMGSSFGWERYIGLEGKVLGIDKFGSSGPGDEVVEAYGFTVENVLKIYKEMNK